MSLLSATPFFVDLRARSGRRRDLRHHGAPHLRLVPGGRPLEPVARQRTAPLRLTRRGRFVVRVGTVLLVLLAVVAGVLLLNRTAQASTRVHPVPATYRVIRPGETLWQIAGQVAPASDRRETVAKIIELNALPSAQISSGQRIAVPLQSR